MSWLCPECGASNSDDDLIRCVCGYEDKLNKNLKTEPEAENEDLNVDEVQPVAMSNVGESSTKSGFLKVLLIVLAIPIIGYAVSFFTLFHLSQDVAADWGSVSNLCDTVRSGKLGQEISIDLKGACQEVFYIELLGKVSIIAGLIGIFIPLMYWLASIFVGQNRRRIVTVFPSVLKLSLLLISGSVIVQGVILTYAVYIAESYAIGRVHIFLIGGIGLGAVIGGFKLIAASMTFGAKLEMNALGKLLKQADAPNLYSLVESLSKKLDAKMPDNIIVGLEPTFYVTSSDIDVLGSKEKISGETLYISAPLARILSKHEFVSVIGHELAHFRGEDTAYSMRFAPIFAGLEKGLHAVYTGEDEGTSIIAKLPAIAMLSNMYMTFSTNVAKISRNREHIADEAGSEVGSPLALSTALIKISLYSNLWKHVEKQNTDHLDQGEFADNLSIVFYDIAKNDVGNDNVDEIMQATFHQSISHPTDAHPPISLRLEKLGVQPDRITKENLSIPIEPAIQLIDNHQDIEEKNTLLLHKFMIALGYANPPEESIPDELMGIA